MSKAHDETIHIAKEHRAAAAVAAKAARATKPRCPECDGLRWQPRAVTYVDFAVGYLHSDGEKKPARKPKSVGQYVCNNDFHKEHP